MFIAFISRLIPSVLQHPAKLTLTKHFGSLENETETQLSVIIFQSKGD